MGKPERVDYAKLAFQPETWNAKGTDTTMDAWKGKEVAFLIQPEKCDPGLLAIWVHRLDQGWALYRDITGRTPGKYRHLDNLPTIAAVPDASYTCGAGCGYVGLTGIELALFLQSDYRRLMANPRSMPHYVFYEMGRNYYTFGDRHSCFITGFAVFMRYVCMDTLGFEDEDGATRRTIEGLEAKFRASGLSFLELFTNSVERGEKSHRIKDEAGKLLDPSDQPCTYASAMLRLWRENGRNDWLRRFYRELAECPEVPAETAEGALRQGWHWFLCASVAAEKDLSPIFADAWKLPIPDKTRSELARVDWKSSEKVKAERLARQLSFP
ncbi:MAG: calcium-binding protein [Verrucomicrobiae bacterium]|nr:calcium-binding protein [Verrucomicrobiae bacterium]